MVSLHLFEGKLCQNFFHKVCINWHNPLANHAYPFVFMIHITLMWKTMIKMFLNLMHKINKINPLRYNHEWMHEEDDSSLHANSSTQFKGRDLYVIFHAHTSFKIIGKLDRIFVFQRGFKSLPHKNWKFSLNAGRLWRNFPKCLMHNH